MDNLFTINQHVGLVIPLFDTERLAGPDLVLVLLCLFPELLQGILVLPSRTIEPAIDRLDADLDTAGIPVLIGFRIAARRLPVGINSPDIQWWQFMSVVQLVAKLCGDAIRREHNKSVQQDVGYNATFALCFAPRLEVPV